MKKITKQEELQKVADALFASNPEIDELHLASNGQGFTEHEPAEAYAKQFEDKKVYHFLSPKKIAEEAEAKKEAELKAEQEAETKAKKEAELKAKQEAEAKAKKKIEKK